MFRRQGLFVLAGLLLFLAVVSQFDLQWRSAGPDLKVLPIAGVSSLADRGDLNLVLIVIDTLRSDHLGAYGYDRPTSPNIDELAARGIRFAHVESQSSWTKASMASLWTSWLPERTGVTRIDSRLASGLRMPAEILRDHGYRTIGLWRNAWVGPTFGFDQGFDFYVQPIASRDARLLRQSDPKSTRLAGSDSDLSDAAIEFLNNAREEQFFLYLHFMDVHQYASSFDSPNFGTGLADLYDSAIHWTDENVGRIVAALAQEDLLNQTVIVIVSDHGESLGDGGREGHARMLHHETQSTPWIIALPFALSESRVMTEPVSNLDIWPTLYSLLGIETPQALDGADRMPAILGEPAAPIFSLPIAQLDQRWGSAEGPRQEVASLREGAMRLIWHRGDRGRTELYDLQADPEERYDRSGEDPARTEEMRAHLEERLAQALSERAVDPEEVELTAEEAAQLRALGYVMPAAEPMEGATE